MRGRSLRREFQTRVPGEPISLCEWKKDDKQLASIGAYVDMTLYQLPPRDDSERIVSQEFLNAWAELKRDRGDTGAMLFVCSDCYVGFESSTACEVNDFRESVEVI